MGKAIFIIVIIILTIFLVILIIQYIPRIGSEVAPELNIGKNGLDLPTAENDGEEEVPDSKGQKHDIQVLQRQLPEVNGEVGGQRQDPQKEQGELQDERLGGQVHQRLVPDQHLKGHQRDLAQSEQGAEPQRSCPVFQAGMNLLVYGHPDRQQARTMFKRLRQLHVNHIAIAFPLFQENVQSTKVEERSTSTPTEEELQSLIEEAHAEELCVMLRPILDEQSFMATGNWRGEIKPTDVDAWFQSYRSLLMKYAKIAEKNDVALFNIGTELSSMERYGHQWKQVIDEMRDVFHGEIIYSFNWNRIETLPSIQFVNFLDHIGLDIYFPLDVEDGADMQTLEKAWEDVIRKIKPYLENRSIVVTETGLIPLAGAYRKPFAWSRVSGKLDRDAQKNYYEATYRIWRPLVHGLYWWAVTLDQNPEVIDYSPLNSPTELLIGQLFSEHAP